MTLLIDAGEMTDDWVKELRATAPHLRLCRTPDPSVRYVLTWKPTNGLLAELDRLSGVISIGAGVDAILQDPGLQPTTPVHRLIAPEAPRLMADYVLRAVSCIEQGRPAALLNPTQPKWSRAGAASAASPSRQIGVLGLGHFGAAVARNLAASGHKVLGAARHRRPIAGVEVHIGRRAALEVASGSDVLVNCLPLTTATRGILSEELFLSLKRGGSLINVGRGEHLVESALVAALEDGQISYAVLDVVTDEPLRPPHPIWSHPQVTVTPHIAATPLLDQRARQLVAMIRTIDAGGKPKTMVNRETGY